MWKKLIQALVMLIIGIGGLSFVQGEIVKLNANESLSSASKAMANIFPLIFACLVIVSIFSVFYGGQAVYRYLKWKAFGNRMKVAYEAKFGYINTGFNQEVDQHIKAMEVLGKGSTKTINEDWLKRMAKFVEIPYVIPEEEYQSEEDKVNKFDDKKNVDDED